eukprot:4429551-Pleurochrysis_carterae.AAC.1
MHVTRRPDRTPGVLPALRSLATLRAPGPHRQTAVLIRLPPRHHPRPQAVGSPGAVRERAETHSRGPHAH